MIHRIGEVDYFILRIGYSFVPEELVGFEQALDFYYEMVVAGGNCLHYSRFDQKHQQHNLQELVPSHYPCWPPD